MHVFFSPARIVSSVSRAIVEEREVHPRGPTTTTATNTTTTNTTTATMTATASAAKRGAFVVEWADDGVASPRDDKLAAVQRHHSEGRHYCRERRLRAASSLLLVSGVSHHDPPSQSGVLRTHAQTASASRRVL